MLAGLLGAVDEEAPFAAVDDCSRTLVMESGVVLVLTYTVVYIFAQFPEQFNDVRQINIT
jgi:hypothetical protein